MRTSAEFAVPVTAVNCEEIEATGINWTWKLIGELKSVNNRPAVVAMAQERVRRLVVIARSRIDTITAEEHAET